MWCHSKRDTDFTRNNVSSIWEGGGNQTSNWRGNHQWHSRQGPGGKNIAVTLISETSLTKQGVIFIKDNTTLIGLLDSRVVVTGKRDPDSEEGSVDQLWNIDLRSLFQQPGFNHKEGIPVITEDGSVHSTNSSMYMTLKLFWMVPVAHRI
jgi:hypothetical protein